MLGAPSLVTIRQELTACLQPAAAFTGRKFTRARTAAEALSLDELRQPDDWLHDRMATAAADEKKKQRHASRIIVQERKTPTGTYQLELVKCGKPACKVCKGGPASWPLLVYPALTRRRGLWRKFVKRFRKGPLCDGVFISVGSEPPRPMPEEPRPVPASPQPSL
jgi:hypothetical protein